LYIKRLEVQGLGLLADASFDFSPTSNIIIGPNRVGKSTTLLAIEIALVGNSAIEGKVEEIVAKGSKNFNIVMELSDGTRVRRTKNDAWLFAQGATEPYAVGSSTVNEAMAVLVGLSSSDFNSIFVAKRETVEDFLSADGIALQRLLERVLNLEDLDVLHKKVVADGAEAYVTLKVLPDTSGLATVEKDLGAAKVLLDFKRQESTLNKGRRDQAEVAVSALLAELQADTIKEAKLSQEVIHYAKSEKEFNELNAEAFYLVVPEAKNEAEAQAKTKVTTLDSSISEFTKVLESINGDLIKASHNNAGIVKASNDYVHLASALGVDVIGVRLADGVETVDSSATHTLVDTSELAASLQGVEVKLKSQTDLINGISVAGDYCCNYTNKVKKLEADVAADNKELTSLTQEYQPLSIENWEVTLENLHNERSKVVAEIATLRKFKEMPICVTCGQSTEGVVDHVHLPTNLEDLNKNQQDISTGISEKTVMWRRANELGSLISSAARSLAEVTGELEDAKSKTKEALAVYVELTKGTSWCDFSHAQIINKMETDAQSIEVTKLKLVSELRLIEQGNAVYTSHYNELESKRKWLNSQKPTETTKLYEEKELTTASLESHKELLGDARANLEMLVAYNAKATRLKEKYDYLQGQIENHKAFLAMVGKPDLVYLELLRGGLVGLAGTIQEAKNDVATYLSDYERVSGELSWLNSEITTLSKEQERLADAKAKTDATKKRLDTSTYVASILSEVRKEIIVEAKNVVSEVATQFCSTVTEGVISEVILGDRLSFTDSGNTFTKARASGAQRALLALGIKQGLATFLPSKLRVMLLDEVTAAMRDDTSAAAMSVLQSLGIQTISVTFREELADNIIQLGE
jgi:DNA repair exonuclease SbcCD ATPase subunit